MPEMKTALEVLREIAEGAHNKEHCVSKAIGLFKHCNNFDCFKCCNATFRAHVKGYAEKYPEGE